MKTLRTGITLNLNLECEGFKGSPCILRVLAYGGVQKPRVFRVRLELLGAWELDFMHFYVSGSPWGLVGGVCGLNSMHFYVCGGEPST